MSGEPLREIGLRQTKTRLVVLGLLVRARRPLTHQEIASCKGVRNLDRVTLYRILSRLQAAGLVHGILGTDGAMRYCFHGKLQRGCPGDHAHFLCRQCGTMNCLPDQKMPRISVPKGSQVEGKQLLVYGHCPMCLSRQNAVSGKSRKRQTSK